MSPIINTTSPPQGPYIAIVAGEASGDHIAASLMLALQQRNPTTKFIGIGGPKMIATGCQSLVPMERLSVMGITAVLRRLPELLSIRKQLINFFLQYRPIAFIGVDSPDFTLGLARRLHIEGIQTIHYVSPSVWAWRQNRVFKIKRDIDLMLTLFPFELDFYQKYKVNAECVGHPLADQIPLEPNQQLARKNLKLDLDTPIIAVLPGSRHSEIQYLGPIFIATMKLCLQKKPNLQFITPLLNTTQQQQFKQLLQHALGNDLDSFPIRFLTGQAQQAICAADAALITSGTATLEAMLLKTPTVVAYRWHPITHTIISPLVKCPFIALPNLLANKLLIPEFIQQQCQPQKISQALLQQFNLEHRNKLLTEFTQLHQQLKCNASERAATAIDQFIALPT